MQFRNIKRGAIALAVLVAIAHGIAPSAAAAVIDVNSLGDDTTPGDALVTLREAIVAANADTATDLGQSGSGIDSIVFTGQSGTIALQSTLPTIATSMHLIGPGTANLTISGDDGQGARTRILLVDGGDLTLTGLRLAQGLARGGNGGDKGQRCGSGGGGLGFGGAVLVYMGTLTARHVDFVDNAAVGGSGGEWTGGADACGGGGGGGIGGDGETTDPDGPVGQPGGTGGSGAPITLAGGAPNSDGGEGAGGGGGSFFGVDLATRNGGDGGFGGGGGGGGQGADNSETALGGDGGFGGGGGGAGASGPSPDLAGGLGGEYGGDGGATTGDRNISGIGGGGAGLGGAVASLGSTLLLEDVRFIDNRAVGGISSSFPLDPNGGTSGEGRGAAVTALQSDARVYRVTFAGSDAADAPGNGFVSGEFSETADVVGVVVDQVLLADDFEGG